MRLTTLVIKRGMRPLLTKFATMAVALVCATQAHALPSFARQTGMDCSGCHIGAFGPQLTPAGIRFKLSGYTESDGQSGKNPLSGMVVASMTRTKADNPEPGNNLKPNNNTKMDEASIFLAGRITENLGAFVQVTYDGIEKKTSLDQTDLRFARNLDIAGKDSIVGISLNNNPGVQDPFNTMPVWSFPYVSSKAGVGTGDAGSLLNGGLSGRVVGTSAYAFVNDSIYGELGTYRSMASSTQKNLGLGSDPQQLKGNAYWRLAWFKDMKNQALQLGLFGWNAKLRPDRTEPAANTYRDAGVDGSYQFIGTREHVATINGRAGREFKSDGATGDVTRIRESRLNASYHFQQTIGGSVGVFSTRSTNASASTVTSGKLLQADWTPWGKENAVAPAPFSAANLRLGVQYWMYDKFAGDSATAKDHNTLYLFAWTSF